MADRLSATFAALADPTRRAILARLATGAATVGDLAEPFDMSLPAVSRHLKVLTEAGLMLGLVGSLGGLVGAICGGAVGLAAYPMESPLIFPAMVIAGAKRGQARKASRLALRGKEFSRFLVS